jgi:alpha-L-arabinofuranosidase
MGPVMVESSVAGVDTYTTKDWHTYVNYQGEVPYLAAHATRSEDGKTLQLMVISRHPSQDYTATIALAGFKPKASVTVRTLTGPDFLAHNDYYKEGDWRSWRTTEAVPPQTCTLTESQATLAFTASAEGVTSTYKVPAHSVLQLVFERAE